MSGNSLMFTDSVICFKELIDKEETAKRQWRGKYGMNKEGWRPVEPFERTGASNCKAELPSGMPSAALRNPYLYRDTVGEDGLAGGAPTRFGGRWDVLNKDKPIDYSHQTGQRVVKKGPHDCYCEIGYNCWSMAGKARTANFGMMGVFEREFYTNTPGELALVWDFKSEEEKVAHAAKIAAMQKQARGEN